MKGTLAIKRKTDTKQAIGYTWICESVSLDEINQRISELNSKYPDEYYEICTNEDLINLLPAPRRRYDCADFGNQVKLKLLRPPFKLDSLKGLDNDFGIFNC